MVLQAVLLGDDEVVVPALVLRHLDVPRPRGGGGGRVDVEGDGHTGGTGGHPLKYFCPVRETEIYLLPTMCWPVL